MRKLIAALAVGFVGLLFFAMGSAEQGGPEIAAANWQPIGPAGGYITGMAFGRSSSEIYATVQGPRGWIFKSTNGSKTWKRTGVFEAQMMHVATAPSNPSIVGAISRYEFFKSINRGSTWTAVSLPLNCEAQRVAFHPTNPNTIYIAGGKVYDTSNWKSCMSFFKSTDGGKHWKVKNFGKAPKGGLSYSLAVCRVNPNIIYLGGYSYDSSWDYSYRIYKSTDGGNSWSDKSSGLLYNIPLEIVIHPTDPTKAYAVTSWGVCRTLDGGNSWQSNTSVSGYSLAIDRTNPDTLYAGYSGMIYKSTDGGANWSASSGSFPGTAYNLLLNTNAPSVAAAAKTIFVGADAGIYKSLNEGESWTAGHSGISAADVPSIVTAQSSPDTIYAELAYNGLFKSTNGGGSWTRLPEFVRCGSIDKVAVSPNSPSEVYITTYG